MINPDTLLLQATLEEDHPAHPWMGFLIVATALGLNSAQIELLVGQALRAFTLIAREAAKRSPVPGSPGQSAPTDRRPGVPYSQE